MSGTESAAAYRLRVVIPILSISWHGGTRVVIQVANYLADQGYRVVFLVARNRCQSPFQISQGIEIRHLGVHTGFKPVDYLIFLFCIPFATRGRVFFLATFFVTYFPIRLLSAATRVPYLYFVQDIESKYAGMQGFFLNPLCNLTYRDVHIVAANNYLRERLATEFGTVCRSISIGPARIFYDLPMQAAKTYDLIYFLRREPWKGIDRFTRFLELADSRFSCLCVSQDEELRDSFYQRNVFFCKPADDAALVACIDSSRLLFLTSYREGFSLPPLECMARGVPSVLFRCGGPDQYIVDGRNAVYVDSEPQAIEAIGKLLGDRGYYEDMCREATLSAENYRMDAALALMGQFIAERTQCRTGGGAPGGSAP